MRRLFPAVCLLLAGCTNAPIAGFLDSCFPCRKKDGTGSGPSVDVQPRLPDGPIRTGPPTPPGPLPPPDLGPGG